ncbi:MAG: Fic family protein [Parvularculales bacterium]
MWVHELENWTNFKWDSEALASKLANVRYRQGLLLGRMEGLGFDLEEVSLNTLTDDVVKSSAIEGVNLNRQKVRSSIARRLGINVGGLVSSGRDEDGIVEMMLDATQNFSEPLTKERLCNWHATLFPDGTSDGQKIRTGDWRKERDGPMQVVSGDYGKERTHYVAPDANRLEEEMQEFLEWFDNDPDIDPVLKVGIAHYWFVAIHPFEDGNGRIGRAICDMALARADGTPKRYFSLSSQIEAETQHYYSHLDKQGRLGSSDLTGWLSWYLDCLERAIANAEKTISNALSKGELWGTIDPSTVNERQQLIINRMLEKNFVGHMNTSKYAKMAKCSNDTALRDIKELKDRGILVQNPGGGRSTSYRLPDWEREETKTRR